MRSTYNWSAAVVAIGDTPGALRRKIQRGLVRLEAPGHESGRLGFTLGDIAALSITRTLVQHGVAAARAFKIGHDALNLLGADIGAILRGLRPHRPKNYPDTFPFLIVSAGGKVRKLYINLDAIQTAAALPAAIPEEGGVVIPVFQVIAASWARLPHIPEETRAWMEGKRERWGRAARKALAAPRVHLYEASEI